jgi:hypothetical protein
MHKTMQCKQSVCLCHLSCLSLDELELIYAIVRGVLSHTENGKEWSSPILHKAHLYGFLSIHYPLLARAHPWLPPLTTSMSSVEFFRACRSKPLFSFVS